MLERKVLSIFFIYLFNYFFSQVNELLDNVKILTLIDWSTF